MKQLVLTRMDAIERAHEAEHLGPWSLSDAQFFEWGWEKHGIGRAIRHEEVLPVSRSLERVCAFYIARLRLRLNERHRRSYSHRYWRMLLMPWLLQLVMCSFERFLRIRGRLTSGVPYLVYLSPSDEKLSFITTNHFGNRMVDADPLNRLIFSRFVRAYQPQGWVMRDGVPAPQDARSLPLRMRSKMEIYHWASILSSNLGCVQFQRVYGLNPLDAASIALRMLFRNRRRWREAAKSFRPAPETESSHMAKDDVIEEIQSIQGIDAEEAGIFLRVLDGLVEETMPRSFTDDFRENEKKASRRVRATAPWTDAIIGYIDHDPWRFYAASLLENRPVKLIGSQHGGDYGLAEALPWQNLVEYQTTDRFISWGWERQSDYPVTAVPASSPILSKMKRSKKRNASIIFVSSGLFVYSLWLRTYYFPEELGQQMMEKVSFIGHLNDELRAVLSYRPHITGASFRYDRANMEKTYPDIQILPGKLVRLMPSRLSSALSQCGVCVFDRPGASAAAFTVAAGIPTVFFGNQNVWRFSRHARADLEKLAEVGVYHASPEGAARHLNAVWPDVDAWWEDGATREAVGAFANRYYRSSKTWRAEWADLLSSADSALWRDGAGAG